MFTEKAQKHANACRFCWMCRHLCPVGLQTGREVNTPRAKGLLISLALRGHAMDKDTAQIMYECTLCGSCTNDCATGYEPPLYIREARSEAVADDLAPQAVLDVIDRELTTGNMFGRTDAPDFEVSCEQPEALLYLGETARNRTTDVAQAMISLMRKAGVRFAVLADEPASGSALGDLMGYVEEVRQQAERCAQAINAVKAPKVIALDSYDLAFMLHQMPEWGVRVEGELTTAADFVRDLVRAGRLTVNKLNLTAAYHDATPDARDLADHDAPRELLEAMGVQLREMFLNRRMAKCCGSEVFMQYAPELAKLTAAGRWDDMHRAGVRHMITANPQAYDVLRAFKPEGDTIDNLFVLLDTLC